MRLKMRGRKMRAGQFNMQDCRKRRPGKTDMQELEKNADLSTMISLCANMCTNGTFIKKTRQNDVVFIIHYCHRKEHKTHE